MLHNATHTKNLKLILTPVENSTALALRYSKSAHNALMSLVEAWKCIRPMKRSLTLGEIIRAAMKRKTAFKTAHLILMLIDLMLSSKISFVCCCCFFLQGSTTGTGSESLGSDSHFLASSESRSRAWFVSLPSLPSVQHTSKGIRIRGCYGQFSSSEKRYQI